MILKCVSRGLVIGVCGVTQTAAEVLNGTESGTRTELNNRTSIRVPTVGVWSVELVQVLNSAQNT